MSTWGDRTLTKRLAGEPLVKPFTRNETSGTFKVFQEIAMGGQEYGANTIKTGGNGEIAQNVADNLGGVGYVGLSYANAPGVKAVPIEGVTPDPANASTYPLSRKLFYYTIADKTSPEAMKFIKWSQSSTEAAAIITEVGFIPGK
ncbi:substrate-binding domain-containing protein [Neorhodopirellula pilleata]|nr:substrate-binding domain-containing protein [Neorhodopirellula pilleata]